MTDYLQPDFYRFNEDSLLLVKEIVKTGLKAGSILDIGAGSGIIGIELALKMKIPNVHFLELQKEWETWLSANIAKYLSAHQVEVFWSSVGKWVPDTKYDLIVSNPPYYLPGKGRLSPDPIRSRCRSFLEDDWGVLLRKSFSALSPEGNAFFVTSVENSEHIKASAGHIPLEIQEKGKVAVIRIRSTEYKSRS